MTNASVDPRVRAIREHPYLGEDSMSDFDEAWSDEELIRALNEELVATPEAAIKWALEIQDLWHEHACELPQYGDTGPVRAIAIRDEWRQASNYPEGRDVEDSGILGGMETELVAGADVFTTEPEGGWSPYDRRY